MCCTPYRTMEHEEWSEPDWLNRFAQITRDHCRIEGYCPTCDQTVEADPIDVVMGTEPSCTECGEFLTETRRSNGND